MKHVFISYTRINRDKAELVEKRLIQAGFIAWLDRDIAVETRWTQEIDEALFDSYALILLVTKELSEKKSIYVSYEIGFAFGYRINVIPLIMDTDISVKHLSEIHLKVAEIQGIVFDSQWGELVNHLSNAKEKNWLSSKDRPLEPDDIVEAFCSIDDLKGQEKQIYLTVDRCFEMLIKQGIQTRKQLFRIAKSKEIISIIKDLYIVELLRDPNNALDPSAIAAWGPMLLKYQDTPSEAKSQLRKALQQSPEYQEKRN